MEKWCYTTFAQTPMPKRIFLDYMTFLIPCAYIYKLLVPVIEHTSYCPMYTCYELMTCNVWSRWRSALL